MTPTIPGRLIFASFAVLLATVCDGQLSPWNVRSTNEIYPPGYTYHGDVRDEYLHPLPPYEDPYGRPQLVYGPHLNKECPIDHEQTNPRNLERLKIEIEECSAVHVSCYLAEYRKYRAIDGSCNNLKHPSWGMANNCLRRILPYDYADKVSHPRISCTGHALPNPRLVSDVFHRELQIKKDPLTTHFMEWGQMLAHDVSLNDIYRTPDSGYQFPPNCCQNGPTVSEQCFSVAVPPTDSFFPKKGITCINFARTMPCPLCKGGQRQHWNQNTAYHDASLLYGSSDEKAQSLRSGVHGMLEVEYNRKSGPMLPTVAVEEICVSPAHQRSCYHAGDPRSNQNLFLLTVHTMLLRNHNFICQELHEINPHWDDEKLYQEARRIVIAQIQKITYTDYLSIILGEIMQRLDIAVRPGPVYTEYDPDLDAGVADEYTSVAARYGHSHVPPTFSEIDPKTGHAETQRLRDSFYTPFGFRYGQFDKIAEGMTKDEKMKHDVFVTGDLRNYLYRRRYMNETTGSDLTSGAIIRGRDHGIPGYTAYLRILRNITVSSFEDLRRILPDKSVDLLTELFESVHDVDLYSAGLAEYYVPEGHVGATFGAILGEQYRRMKFGDRYWFEHKNQPGSFTPEQLQEIKRTTLSRIICETTKISEIQPDVFRPPSHRYFFLIFVEVTEIIRRNGRFARQPQNEAKGRNDTTLQYHAKKSTDSISTYGRTKTTTAIMK